MMRYICSYFTIHYAYNSTFFLNLKQVKKLGVHLNFKKKLRRLLFWCIGSTTVQITFTVITFLVYKRLRSKSDTYILKFVCSYVFQPFVAVATLTIYFVLIFNLYRRFQVINDLLRCEKHSFTFNFVVHIHFSILQIESVF